jgi:hypothetical protein
MHSVHKGIGTQFLEQSALSDQLQCRVWWWLSLAFYVKALRTPWVLDDLHKDSAYVSTDMSYDPAQAQGKRVVMGCSHIYSSRDEGLQYRLSKVENPVFYGKNPFLSRDDARRVGEQIRELFFESRSSIPKRVVIHKRTRFSLFRPFHGASFVNTASPSVARFSNRTLGVAPSVNFTPRVVAPDSSL